MPNLVTSSLLCSRHINIILRQKVQNYTKCIHCIDEGRHVTNPHSGANRPLTHPPESSMGIIFFPSTRIMETIPSHSCPLPGSLGVWPFFPVAALLETYWRATLSPLQTYSTHDWNFTQYIFWTVCSKMWPAFVQLLNTLYLLPVLVVLRLDSEDCTDLTQLFLSTIWVFKIKNHFYGSAKSW